MLAQTLDGCFWRMTNADNEIYSLEGRRPSELNRVTENVVMVFQGKGLTRTK